jgi:hypothetical protein
MINVTLWRGRSIQVPFLVWWRRWHCHCNLKPGKTWSIRPCAQTLSTVHRRPGSNFDARRFWRRQKWLCDRYEAICYLEELVARNCISLTATNGNHPLKLQNEQWRLADLQGHLKLFFWNHTRKRFNFKNCGVYEILLGKRSQAKRTSSNLSSSWLI